MDWKPLGRRVIVKPVDIKKEKSNIMIPDHAKERRECMLQECVIVSIGDGAFNDDDYKNLRVNVGDTVRIVKYVGDHFPHDDNSKYRIINDVDVLAILTNKGLQDG